MGFLLKSSITQDSREPGNRDDMPGTPTQYIKIFYHLCGKNIQICSNEETGKIDKGGEKRRTRQHGVPVNI